MENTNTAAQPLDLDELAEIEAIALAAPKVWYGTYQIVDGISDEKAVALVEACSPDTILALIAKARAAKPASAKISMDERTTAYHQGYQAGIAMGKALAADEGAADTTASASIEDDTLQCLLVEYRDAPEENAQKLRKGINAYIESRATLTPVADQQAAPGEKIVCPGCNGIGTWIGQHDGYDDADCHMCDGAGKIAAPSDGAAKAPAAQAVPCEHCNEGKQLRFEAGPNGPIEHHDDCDECDGSGFVEPEEEPAAQAVPAGFKLVPINPTDAMIAACKAEYQDENATWFTVYRAILAATPASNPKASQQAADVDLSKLPTYDPERDTPGCMELRDKYNDGDYYKVEDVQAAIKQAAAVAAPEMLASGLREILASATANKNLYIVELATACLSDLAAPTAGAATTSEDAWIDVKDRLPEPWGDRLFSESVLIVDMDSRYPHVRMSELNFEEHEGKVVPTVWSGADPTHWKPAPALPAMRATQQEGGK